MLKFSLSAPRVSVFTILSLCIRNVLGDGTVTITEAAAYSALLPCAQQCIYSQNLGCPNIPDPIGNAIGCYNNLNAGCQKVPWAMNSCYCRSDLQANAVKAISTCVLSRCTIGDSIADFTSVADAYTGYCLQAGYAVNTGVAAAATPVGGGNGATSTPGAGVAGSTSGEFLSSTSINYPERKFLPKSKLHYISLHLSIYLMTTWLIINRNFFF